jgi:hypothetical protein
MERGRIVHDGASDALRSERSQLDRWLSVS